MLSSIFLISDILNKSKDELIQMKTSHDDKLNKEKMKSVRQCKKTKSINKQYSNCVKLNSSMQKE